MRRGNIGAVDEVFVRGLFGCANAFDEMTMTFDDHCGSCDGKCMLDDLEDVSSGNSAGLKQEFGQA